MPQHPEHAVRPSQNKRSHRRGLVRQWQVHHVDQTLPLWRSVWLRMSMSRHIHRDFEMNRFG
jgi:hypothetical protein